MFDVTYHTFNQPADDSLIDSQPYISYNTISYAVPYHAMPCHAMPCNAMQCHEKRSE